MKTYRVSLKYSIEGNVWTRKSLTVRAESDMSAIVLVSSMYPHVKDIKVLSAR